METRNKEIIKMFVNEIIYVKDILNSLSLFDDEAVPTILEGYIKPIHHIRVEESKSMPSSIVLVVNEAEQDIYIKDIRELKMELSKYPEDYFVFVDDSVRTSIECISDEIYDININEDETLIPGNVSFFTTVHMMM